MRFYSNIIIIYSFRSPHTRYILTSTQIPTDDWKGNPGEVKTRRRDLASQKEVFPICLDFRDSFSEKQRGSCERIVNLNNLSCMIARVMEKFIILP